MHTLPADLTIFVVNVVNVIDFGVDAFGYMMMRKVAGVESLAGVMEWVGQPVPEPAD